MAFLVYIVSFRPVRETLSLKKEKERQDVRFGEEMKKKSFHYL